MWQSFLGRFRWEGLGKGGGQSSHHDVAAPVQGQVVGPGEGAVTFGAAERLDPCVLSEMSRQLVRPSEAPGAALPGAVVRLLSCVYSPMSFEM